jgi:hypothetical protein
MTFKNTLKKYLYPYLFKNNTNAAVQLQLAQLKHSYKVNPLENVQDSESNVFTYHGEDGLLFYLIAQFETINKRFVDIGAGNCVKSNCANLATNLGWKGLFIEGDNDNLVIGKRFYAKHMFTKYYPPIFQHAFVTAENCNELIIKNDFEGNIGLLSIDIDGNDYWIWKALTVIQPSIVIIETKVEYGLNDIITPYSEKNNNQINQKYSGTSIPAMIKLAQHKGYRLVAANRHAYNLIFVKESNLLQTVPTLTASDIMQFSSVSECFLTTEELNKFTFVTENL